MRERLATKREAARYGVRYSERPGLTECHSALIEENGEFVYLVPDIPPVTDGDSRNVRKILQRGEDGHPTGVAAWVLT